MKRVLTALAVALTAIFAVAGCNDYGNTFQANTGAVVTTLSPSNIDAGSGSFTLTLNGSGFVTQTYITWNGGKLATSDILDASGDVLQVYATIPASLVANPGKALILTHNPYSGAGNNGLSNPVNFIINPPTQPNTDPLLQSISPTGVNAGAGPTTLTLTGTNFLTSATPPAIVCWNSGTTTSPMYTPLTISAASSSQITVSLPANLLSSPGINYVTVVNPPNSAGTAPTCTPPVGLVSGPLAFTVFPVPTLTSISPTSATAGSAALQLTLTGTNFVSSTNPSQGATVFWSSGGTTTQLAVASMTTPSATQIVATVPATLIANAGTANVYVVNPPPLGSGAASSSQVFTINASGAAIANAAEETPALSADGRYVAYTAGDGQHTQIYFRDTCAGAVAGCVPQTSLVTLDAEGAAANEDSHTPSMSADGRYVAFSSAATNLVGTLAVSSTAAGRQVYLRDMCTGASAGCVPATQLVSTDASGQLLGAEGILPSVSASGRFVAFVAVAKSAATAPSGSSSAAAQTSSSTNNGYQQIFVRDTCLGATNCTAKTSRISLQPGSAADGAPAAGTAPAGPAVSGDARKIALNGGGTAVLFTQSLAVDDRVFVAALQGRQ
jgi:hypothetical protein